MNLRSVNFFSTLVGIGLFLVVVLIIVLVVVAQQLTQVTIDRSSQMVEHQQKKLNHLMNLHIAGQSRTIHLQQMVLSNDPIDQNEALIQFYQNASDYMTHREQIGALIDNNPFEIQWFAELFEMARTTGPLQSHIAQLAMQQPQQATDLLNRDGMAQLYAFTQKIQDFSSYQEQAIHNAIAQSRQNIDQLMRTVLGLAITLIVVSLVFALIIIKKFNSINQALRLANDQLEDHVKERTAELVQAQNELLDKNRALEKMSSTDSLTGLYNRFKMDQFLATAHQRFLQHGEAYHIMFIDIDHFKPINDQHGHAMGDKILQQFAMLLTHEFGSDNLIGRWGGEEFIILHANPNLQQACDVAEQIRQRVEQSEFASDIPVTVSIGVAKVDFKDQVKDVINRADIALYKAKNTGRNQVSSALSRPSLAH